MRTALGWILVLATSALIAVVAFLHFRQHSMLYHPRPYDAQYAHSLPADAIEIDFTTAAGRQVAFYLPRGLDRTLPQRLWIAFCGNGSLALDWTVIKIGIRKERSS